MIVLDLVLEIIFQVIFCSFFLLSTSLLSLIQTSILTSFFVVTFYSEALNAKDEIIAKGYRVSYGFGGPKQPKLPTDAPCASSSNRSYGVPLKNVQKETPTETDILASASKLANIWYVIFLKC